MCIVDLTQRCKLINLCFVFIVVKARLAGSGLRQEGRLEVRYKGTWGTVTDDGFSSVDAKVFCYDMGFGSVSAHYLAHLCKIV